jgi:hypothetical protein
MRIARGISVTNTSKPISTAIVYDADAAAFFTAASITDTTQKSAVNTLVLSLKSANIWTKMKALYPVVGGIASSHAVNLKQPGTFNLSFATGWTHSSTGMTPNGATYANTSLIPSAILTIYNGHFGFYSRTTAFKSGASYFGGCYQGNQQGFGMYQSSSNTSITAVQHSTSIASDFAQKTALANKKGFLLNSRTSATSTSLKLIINGVTQANATTTSGGFINTNTFYLGAVNDAISGNPTFYDNSECAFASIGDGLTDAEALSFYNAVQTYQITLGRQV